MTRNTFKHKQILGLAVALAGVCWVGLAWLIFELNVGDYSDFWFGGRVLTYVLLLVAPALTFVPLGRTFGLKLFGYWTVLAWLVFGLVLTFVPSDPTSGPSQNIGALAVLLLSFFAVLVSVLFPLCYAIGAGLTRNRPARLRPGNGRAWREAIGLAGYIVLLAFLRAIGSLNSFSALILFLILVVVELLFLARSR